MPGVGEYNVDKRASLKDAPAIKFGKAVPKSSIINYSKLDVPAPTAYQRNSHQTLENKQSYTFGLKMREFLTADKAGHER